MHFLKTNFEYTCIFQGDIHFQNTKFEYTYTHIHFFWHLCFDIQNLNAIFLWTNGHKLCAFLLIKNEKQPRGPKRHPKKPKRWKKLVAKKIVQRVARQIATRVQWGPPGVELPQFHMCVPPWFCLGALLSKFLVGWKVLDFSPSRSPSWLAGGGIYAPLVVRPEGSPSCATTCWPSAWWPNALGAAGGNGPTSQSGSTRAL